MSTEILDPGSVVDARAQEKLEKGSVKSYGEGMKAVLKEDAHLAFCYLKNYPFIESKSYQEDPARAQIVQGITEPPPTGQATATAPQPSEAGTSAMQELGILISGARLADNSPDVVLMIRIANLVPQLVRDAASERMNAIAYAIIARRNLPGTRSDVFPNAYAEAVQENPELAATANGGVMNENALKEIFFGWFSRG